jgi:hypothetical protein
MADPAAELWTLVQMSAGVGAFVGGLVAGGASILVASRARREAERLKTIAKSAIRASQVFCQELDGAPSAPPPARPPEDTVNLFLEERRVRARAEQLERERSARNPLDQELERRRRMRDAEDSEYARQKVDELERPLRRYNAGKDPHAPSTPPEGLPPYRPQLPPRRG